MIKLSNHVIGRHLVSSTKRSMSQVSNMSSTVFYDLETTGFGQAQIVGLGAVDNIGNTFHRYIIPTCSITPGASKVHGITKVKNELFIHGQKIQDSVHPNEGLEDFIEWIDELKPKYLVAHNNHQFDLKILKFNLNKFKVVKPMKKVVNKDSLEFVRNEFKLASNTLAFCLKHFCGRVQEEPHDALADSIACKDVCEAAAKQLGFISFDQYLEDQKETRRKAFLL